MTQKRGCSVCGGPLSERNTSGICARTPDCRSALQSNRRSRREASGSASLLLEPAYELEEDGDEYARDENGQLIEIVDQVTVRVLVSGVRRVAYTERERDLAILAMIKQKHRFREIATNIGTSPDKLKPVIEALGYELIPRRHPGGRGLREATEIRKVPR